MVDGRPSTAPVGNAMPRGSKSRHATRSDMVVIQERRLDTMVDELTNREMTIRSLEAEVSAVGVSGGDALGRERAHEYRIS